ncbi:MAG TPA: amidase family protein, partial [Burkholderiaceae bacterium]
LKPSHGRVPLDPPFMALAAGPMTRTVGDAALMMGVLSRPDPADYMSLPYQDIDWMQLERDLRGLRIGLLLDGGHGLATEPETRAAIEAAARRFEAAGAIVEHMKPWATSQLVDGIDRFWRTRSNADLALLPPERREKILPFVRAWAETGAGHTGADVFQGYAATTAMRAATVRATQPYDFVLSPVAAIAAFDGALPMPTNDVATAMHHITFTVPFSMSEQPAISVNGGYTSDGLPIGLQIAGRRFDDLGVLQMARAWEEMRPAERPFPVKF